tara:strand:+ start:1100 stop:1711 length:612 start_codon:yes stop_codon:yes gene_type:complete
MNKENQAVDFELEEFYIGFKQSMTNFYINHTFKRPINDWSARLNKLQGFKNYKEIHKLITKIISLYAIDLMRVCDYYNAGILDTNIKRFNRITINIDNLEKIDNDTSIVFLLFNIFKSLIKTQSKDEIKKLFNQVELYLIYEDYTKLITYSVKRNKLSILDKLFKYSNECLLQAMNIYNIVVDDIFINDKTVISGKKFVDLIN